MSERPVTPGGTAGFTGCVWSGRDTPKNATQNPLDGQTPGQTGPDFDDLGLI